MALIKKFSPFQNLSNYKTFLVDTQFNSEFFRISEFNEVFTGGKNGFLIEGSPHLKALSDIRVEVLDVNGNPVYFEPGDGIPEYYEGNSLLCSVHVYDDTPIGIGKITILGELETYVNDIGETVPVPAEWVGAYNVKWEREFQINRLLSNEDIVRFYERPRITITELSKPIFAVSSSAMIQTGSLRGEGIIPIGGSSLRNWTKGTQYKLVLTDSTTWPQDVVNNDISIPGLDYSPTIIEILNEKEAITNIPYTVSNTVTNFTNESYTASYIDTENEVTQKSALTGSFAQIKMTQLKTFVGDVARVKVFRSSRSEAGGFQFIQETKLESTELLADFTTTDESAILYGILSQNNVDTYWESSSVAHTISTNNDILFRSIQINYDTGSSEPQLFRTQNEINITNDVEYTLDFKTKLSGSVSDTKYLKAYLSSSEWIENITEFSASEELTSERLQVSENIITQYSGSAKLVFEIVGDDWYISNISFKNAQDTSFSPDEFTLIQDVPRKLPVETYDYKFEFYDINNNYIPVDVTATKEFVLGNINEATAFPVFNLTSPAPYFRFATGSIGNPAFQQVNLNITRNIFTGSILYSSAAFDENGDYIPPGSYTGAYPGTLTDQSDFGGVLSIGNFTGSDATYQISSIFYTASLSGSDEERYLRVYRINEGLAQSELFASANTYQFLYRLDTLEPRPSGQIINVSVKRKQLDGILAPITANSSSGAPPLTPTSDIDGVKTYIISASNFPYTTGEATYAFTGSDQFGFDYTDSISIVPTLDTDSIVPEITKTSVAFAADSSGNVTGTEFNKGDGVVSVRVGSVTASFQDGLVSNNRFDIDSAVGVNCTPNEAFPTTDTYGISAMSQDSATLILTIRYKAGDGTINTFTRDVTYTKVRAASATVPDGTVSGSDQVTSSLDTRYVLDSNYQVDSGSFDSRIDGIVASGSGADWNVNLTNIPVGIVSGSSQLDGTTIDDLRLTSATVTGSFQTNTLELTGNAHHWKINTNITSKLLFLAENVSGSGVYFSKATIDQSGTPVDATDLVDKGYLDSITGSFGGGGSIEGTGGVVVASSTASLGGSIDTEVRTIEIIGGLTDGLVLSGSYNAGDDYSYTKFQPQRTELRSFDVSSGTQALVDIQPTALLLQNQGGLLFYGITVSAASDNTRIYASSGSDITEIRLTKDTIRLMTPAIQNSTATNGEVFTLIDDTTGEGEWQAAGGGSLTGSGGVQILNNTASLGGTIANESYEIELLGGFSDGVYFSGSQTGTTNKTYTKISPREVTILGGNAENTNQLSVSPEKISSQLTGDSGSAGFEILPLSQRNRMYYFFGGNQTEIITEPTALSLRTNDVFNGSGGVAGYILVLQAGGGSGEAEWQDISGSLPAGLVSGSSQVDLTQTTNYVSGIKDRLDVEGVISGSSQLTTEFDTRYLNTGGDSVVSGSDQVTSSLDSVYVYTKADSPQTIEGQKTFTNIITFDNGTVPLRFAGANNSSNVGSGTGYAQISNVPDTGYIRFSFDDNGTNATNFNVKLSNEQLTSAKIYQFPDINNRTLAIAPEVTSETGTAYTIQTDDAYRAIRFEDGGSVTVTVEQGSLTEIGEFVEVDYWGSGSLTINQGSGSVVLLKNENRTFAADGQYSRIAIQKMTTTEYRVFGELASV